LGASHPRQRITAAAGNTDSKMYHDARMTAAGAVGLDHIGSPATPYLGVNGLWKTFGSFVALRDINLSVHEGEFVCFLGPSGCGKTTLLRAIAGLDPQTRGTIVQGGSDIST